MEDLDGLEDSTADDTHREGSTAIIHSSPWASLQSVVLHGAGVPPRSLAWFKLSFHDVEALQGCGCPARHHTLFAIHLSLAGPRGLALTHRTYVEMMHLISQLRGLIMTCACASWLPFPSLWMLHVQDGAL